MAWVLQAGLAVTHRDEVVAGNAVILAQVALDRVCAPIGETLVVGVAAGGIRVAGDDEGRPLQVWTGQGAAESFNQGPRSCVDGSRIVVEVDFEIDLRLFFLD